MDETAWFAVDTPYPMLRHVRGRVSSRKLQLLSCGVARLVWPHMDDAQREVVQVAERFAEGEATHADRLAASGEAARHFHAHFTPDGGLTRDLLLPRLILGVVATPLDEGLHRAIDYAIAFARRERLPPHPSMPRRVCEVFREVVGNPFRPPPVAPPWLPPDAAPGWLLKVSDTARAVAAGVQAEQAFDRLPILADALEEGGCTDVDVLVHLRDPAAVHRRGCWALDLVLGR